jgi:5'-nucleotidase/UDP-sugar diphosphatase
MRHLVAAAVIAFSALSLSACSGGTTTKSLVILHTNDEHSHLIGDGPEADDFPAPTTAGTGKVKGGLARRAALFAKERAAATSAGSDTLTVSAGDNAFGTLAELGFVSGTDYSSLGLLKYDVTTFGNHEFDYGPIGLAASVTAGFTSSTGMPAIVASNIHFSGTAGDAMLAALFDESGLGLPLGATSSLRTAKVPAQQAQPIHRTWVITTANGLRVGFVGILGVGAAYEAPLKGPVKFSVAALGSETDTLSSLAQLYDDVQPLVDRLRARDHVDLVVALSHSGVEPGNVEAGEDQQIAENVGGIDVIVSGHTHTNYPAQLVTNAKTGRKVLIQQAGRYGDHYGRIVMKVKQGAASDDLEPVTFDMTQSTTVPIDDTTVGDAAAAGFVSQVYGTLETAPVAALGGLSYLAYTASIAAGAQLTASATNVGAVAFHPIAKAGYTIHQGAPYTETPLLRAAADSMLAATEAFNGHTDVAIEAAGVVRGDIIPSAGGSIAFGDLFQAVPLGISPSHQPGYPLTRFAVYLAELKAAFEVTAGFAYTSGNNADFFVVPAGMCFRYDTSRPAYNNAGSPLDPTNGRVTEIRMMADHKHLDDCATAGTLLYSTASQVLAQSPTGYLAQPLGLYTVAANLYVAQFASVAGVKLKDPHTGIAYASPIDAIEYATLAPGVIVEIKEWEAMGEWFRALTALPSSNNTLPSIYDDSVPAGAGMKRAICSGPLCK